MFVNDYLWIPPNCLPAIHTPEPNPTGQQPHSAGQGSMAFTMHSHSGQFCPGHAKDQLEEVVKHAISIGYKTIGLTEHMPRTELSDLYPEEVSDSLTCRHPLTHQLQTHQHPPPAHALPRGLPRGARPPARPVPVGSAPAAGCLRVPDPHPDRVRGRMDPAVVRGPDSVAAGTRAVRGLLYRLDPPHGGRAHRL